MSVRYVHEGQTTEVPPSGDWWTVVDGCIRLERSPNPGEELPRVYRIHWPTTAVGGGATLPVRAPNGDLLRYGEPGE